MGINIPLLSVEEAVTNKLARYNILFDNTGLLFIFSKQILIEIMYFNCTNNLPMQI